MKLLATTVLSLSLCAGASAQADQATASSNDGAPALAITRSGSQPSAKGSVDYFTGSVRIDPLFQANVPSRASGAMVTFELGAHRVAHPSGWSSSDRDGRSRLGPVMGRRHSGHQTGRCRPDPAGCEALAWRHGHNGHDPHRHPGAGRRQGGRLDGAGQRRAMRPVMLPRAET
jgi:hypothetical protein